MLKPLVAVALLISVAPPQEKSEAENLLQERVRDATASFDRAHQKFELALVELGPAAIPELERISASAQGPRKEAVRASIEKIKSLREPIEKLVAELGGEKIETREKATIELRRIGSPARTYLEAALRSENAEVRARAGVLLVMISPRDRERARWAAIAEAHAQRIGLLENQMKAGTISGVELFKAKRDLLKARHKAGQITLQEYLKTARDFVERAAGAAQVNFRNGVTSWKEWMAARLELLYLDRRLGNPVDKEIEALQMQWMELARMDKSKGLLGEAELLKQLVAFLTDPDEDLDD
jgi:hypothetical protein